jgi:biofilm PGA synthesis N-glycosyltransferase PgaC
MQPGVTEKPATAAAPSRRYVLIAPCRDEAATIRVTLESLARQTLPPSLLVVVDDGSTDATPEILREYQARLPWLRVVTRADRGARKVGGGVIEAFNAGLASITLEAFEFVCKLDMDLDLPPTYFAGLVALMDADPDLATCSGKPYFRTADGALVSEFCGDETSVGMTKFYRVSCFQAVGGFVMHVGWDTIDCHSCRMHGWKALSFDLPELRFVHLRPMGSSQVSIWVGRQRHGRGTWYLGTIPPFMAVSVAYRMTKRPFLVGGLGMALGYVKAWLSGAPRYAAPGYLGFVRGYQLRALVMGKRRAAEAVRLRAYRQQARIAGTMSLPAHGAD